MRTSFLFAIFASSLSFLSCNSQVKNEERTSSYQTPKTQILDANHTSTKAQNAQNTTRAQNNKANHVPIKYFDMKDSRNGISTGSIPLPENFERHTSGRYQFTGPNDIKMSGTNVADFAFSNNQQEVYRYQTMNFKIQFPQSLDQIIEGAFVPYGNKINRKLVRSYPLPEVAAFYKQFDGVQFKINYVPKVFESRGIEWEDPDGTSFLTVLTRNAETGPQAHYWGYVYTVIQSPKAQFELAKKILINSIANQQVNYNWVQTMNAQTKSTIDASEARYQAQSATIKRNMDLFRESQALRKKNIDAVNEQMYDYLTDRKTVVDPATGTERKPEAGATYYWYNEDGTLVTSDKSYYDPNKDPAMNQGHTWTLNKSKY